MKLLEKSTNGIIRIGPSRLPHQNTKKRGKCVSFLASHPFDCFEFGNLLCVPSFICLAKRLTSQKASQIKGNFIFQPASQPSTSSAPLRLLATFRVPLLVEEKKKRGKCIKMCQLGILFRHFPRHLVRSHGKADKMYLWQRSSSQQKSRITERSERGTTNEYLLQVFAFDWQKAQSGTGA